MAINSRQKGVRAEREVAKILKEHGYTEARRSAQYCGNSGEAADVVGFLDGFHLEVKRCETTKIWDWIHQAERDHKADTVPLVVFRRSHEQWHVALSLEAFLELLKKKEQQDGREEINTDIP